MSLVMELGLGPGDFVRWEPSCPLPKRGADPPNFPPMFIVYWMKLVLGVVVGLSPGDFVLSLTNFGRDPRRSGSRRASRNFVFFSVH